MFSAVSMAGTPVVMFSAGPTFVPGLAFARIACTARPWPSTAWWRTWFNRPGGSFSPGANRPVPCPSSTTQ
jgi:hypothetical protein